MLLQKYLEFVWKMYFVLAFVNFMLSERGVLIVWDLVKLAVTIYGIP